MVPGGGLLLAVQPAPVGPVSVLERLGLNPDQRRAVCGARRDRVLTAGPGSGKTLTLVARYLWLLEQGLPPRRIVAVTFTQKAARQLRNRVRQAIGEHLPALRDPGQRAWWERCLAELAAAPVGTIHSLCARILRLHCAQAGLDPDFEVLEEGQVMALKAQAAEEALAWAANDPQGSRLFAHLEERELRATLEALLALPLEAQEAFAAMGSQPLEHWRSLLEAWLSARLDHPSWRQCLQTLESGAALDGGDRLEVHRREVLEAWRRAEGARAAGDWPGLLSALQSLRAHLDPRAGSRSLWRPAELARVRGALLRMRRFYEATLSGLLGGEAPDPRLDQLAAGLLPALAGLFQRALSAYSALKDEALDFDDLESRAVNLLLARAEVRRGWRRRVAALLVDEFQDTNRRQDQLVELLAGRGKGRLFLVGDAQQSIYRFRGADVTVFRRRLEEFERGPEAESHVLQVTYRAHQGLVTILNGLLPRALPPPAGAQRAYAVPFLPLVAHRSRALPWAEPPYLELHLGLAERAEEARRLAASALARRLAELAAGGLDWGGMALLFRSSSNFSVWEDALEAAGIPFLTVAGRGFYHRPEVRDVLNALVALEDPSDDLAMAGVLRSPVFALSDASLYRLRWDGHTSPPRSLWSALRRGAVELEEPQRGRARRAGEILARLHQAVGRLPVGDLIRLYLQETHYPALLNLGAEGARAGRNLEKLVQDALDSRLVSVGQFLQYVDTLRDAGVREGEAPGEAGDAVQLMTAHKAKGLEFALVVLADAGYGRFSPSGTLVHPLWGVVPRVREEGRPGAFYRWASLQEADQAAEEERRLLYVAATRAREKLLVSGHARPGRRRGLLLDGWLQMIGRAVGLDQIILEGAGLVGGDLPLRLPAAAQGEVGCRLYSGLPPVEVQARPERLAVGELPAHLPLTGPLLPAPGEREDGRRRGQPAPRTWRVVPQAGRSRAPRWVLGAVVHQALRQWVWPAEEGFERLVRVVGRDLGVVDGSELDGLVSDSARLLERLAGHPLRAELEAASARHHEVPYTCLRQGKVEHGVVDLLYRGRGGWEVVEFKTDEIRGEEELGSVLARHGYEDQALRYASALAGLLGERPRVRLCLLDCGGQLRLLEVSPR